MQGKDSMETSGHVRTVRAGRVKPLRIFKRESAAHFSFITFRIRHYHFDFIS